MERVWAVFLFEWRRAMTLPRLAWWFALTLFPSAIVLLIRSTALERIPPEPWAILLFALAPMLLTMLGAFLWTTPAISAELERKSWVYLAVRPYGRVAVLLGKYLAAVTWVLPSTLVGLTLAVLLAQPDGAWKIWTTLVRLSCLSCPAYAAVYLLLGVVVPNRAMVIAVAYTLIFELIIASIPALVNKFSIQFRLRALFVDWAEMPVPDRLSFEALALLGDSPAWHHVLILAGYTLAILCAAIVLIQNREFTAAEEAEL